MTRDEFLEMYVNLDLWLEIQTLSLTNCDNCGGAIDLALDPISDEFTQLLCVHCVHAPMGPMGIM